MLTYGASKGALGGTIDIPPGGDGRAELEIAHLTLGRKVCLLEYVKGPQASVTNTWTP